MQKCSSGEARQKAVDALANAATGRSTNAPGRGAVRVVPKIAGGYVKSATLEQLVAVAWCYETKAISKTDFRVAMAFLEVQERRRFIDTTKQNRKPKLKAVEFCRLVGCAESQVRRSAKKLRAVGLLHDGSDGPMKLGPVGELNVPGREHLEARLELVSMPKRVVPLPRSVIALIASGNTTRVESATLLGHASRCLFLKNGNEVGLTGSVKSGWVSDVFGVSASNVRTARAKFTKLGVWTEVSMPQGYTNRFGTRVEFNPEFMEPGKKRRAPVEKSETRARNQDSPNRENEAIQDGHINQTLLPSEEAKHQTLAGSASAQTGVSEQEPEGKKATVGPEKADLRNVQSSDLGNPSRLLELHVQAAALGLVPETERGRLLVFSAAERALTKGTKNAPGLFVWCLRSGGRHISGENEDAALRSLKNLDGGGGERGRGTSERELADAAERRAQLARLELQQRLGEPLSETTLRWMRTQKQELEQSSEKPLGQLAHHLLEKLLGKQAGGRGNLQSAHTVSWPPRDVV